MDYVRVEISDRVATVTFDRPPVNALDAQAYREITEAFRSLGQSREASVIIFTAPGERVFCAGVDFADSARRHARKLLPEDTTVDLLDTGAIVRDCFWAVLDCPLPVICALNGAAIGAGLALVASCDILIASEKASLSVSEIKVGVLGGARHLHRLVGTHKARMMYFTGEPVSAQELYRLGTVEKVVPPDQLMATARQLASEIAKLSPIGLRLAKEAMNRVEDMPLREGYRLEQDYTTRVGLYNDAQEAKRARQEKRDPNWSWT